MSLAGLSVLAAVARFGVAAFGAAASSAVRGSAVLRLVAVLGFRGVGHAAGPPSLSGGAERHRPRSQILRRFWSMPCASHRFGHRLHSRRELLRRAASCAIRSVLLLQVRRHGDTCGRLARVATYLPVRRVAGIGLEGRPAAHGAEAHSFDRLGVAANLLGFSRLLKQPAL